MDKKFKKYTIGVDIGTNSIGTAVVYHDLKIVKKRMRVSGNTGRDYIKKNFLGALLFDEGKAAKFTRAKRCLRRRYERRKNRINYLRDFFKEEIEKIDKDFFNRLDNSFFIKNDNKNKYPIFADFELENKYHKQYPTIYHLRKALIDEDKKADIRLIYMALSHIIKFRGHFLSNNLKISNITKISIKEDLDNLYKLLSLVDSNNDIKKFQDISYIENILISEIPKSDKKEKLEKILNKNKKILVFFDLLIGNTVNFKNIFELDEDIKLKFQDKSYEENLERLISLTGEQYRDIFILLDEIYMKMELSKIIDSKDNITQAFLSNYMIKLYDHLKLYKNFVRNLGKEEYKNTFRKGKIYDEYILGRKTLQDLYKHINKQLINAEEKFKFKEYTNNQKIQESIEYKQYIEIKKLVDKEEFLRKLRSIYNCKIPYQLQLKEFEDILNKQSKYYTFIDDNKEKLKALLTFRIPYYVGPLVKNTEMSRFSWLKRKKEGKIYPWNLEEIVDVNETSKNFIKRLIGNDTYLYDEKVLPKEDIIYQKFNIFNELTRVSYIDENSKRNFFTTQEKKEIFNNLFKKNKKVSLKLLTKYIENEWNKTAIRIIGLEKEFNSNYSTYIDLSKIKEVKEILDREDYIELIQEIIKILTVFEDGKLRKNNLDLLNEKYDNIFSDVTIGELSKIHYKGWGRLSNKLINGIRNKNDNKTILDYLIDDKVNRNFMQLINDDTLSFKDEIKKKQDESFEKNILDKKDEYFKNLDIKNPAIKKAISLSIRLINEIVDIMEYNPENIVIEMARENQTTLQGKKASKNKNKKLEEAFEKLKKLNENIDINTNDIKKSDLNNKKLYLYYLQNGKDMYTGEMIDLNNLQNYQIDHIIPQSFITDNSIDNLVLVKNIKNIEKSDEPLSSDIIKRQKHFWTILRNVDLISDSKFNNLIKDKFTQNDKERFINRQLVETRQITKYVANILSNKFQNKTNIILLKAPLITQFREKFNIYKVRELNDYHHAHDAYLNACIAIKLLEMYPNLHNKLIYGKYDKNTKVNIFNKATYEKNKMINIIKSFENYFVKIDNDIKSYSSLVPKANMDIIWDKDRDIKIIKNTISREKCNIVKKVEEQKGMLFKETINKKGKGKISIKNNMDTDIYGGYIKAKPAYFIALEYKVKNKIKKDIVPINIKDKKEFEKDKSLYLKKLKYEDAKILFVLKKYSLFEICIIDENNTKRILRRTITGGKELNNVNQIVLDNELVEFIYYLKKIHNDPVKDKCTEKYLDENKSRINILFKKLLENILDFAKNYLEINGDKIRKIRNAYSEYLENNNEMIEEVNKDIVASFIELLKLTKAGAASEFKFLGETIERKRYNSIGSVWSNKDRKVELVYQSLSGLYETRFRME